MHKQEMGNGEIGKSRTINWVRLSSLINICLFILPLFVFSPLVIFAKVNMLVLFASFLLSSKYFISKDISKFSEIFLMLSVFINFFTNVIAIALLHTFTY